MSTLANNRWILGARPRTLAAAVAPVLVGTAAARYDQLGAFSPTIWWRAACALGVAVFVQVATNYANDYSDGVRGVDDPTKRAGPVRLVGSGLATASEVKRAMIVAFALTLVCGTPLVLFVSPWLALVGVASVAAGWFYTGGPRPYGYAGFGEVFVFVFFGLVATTASAFVQIETVNALTVVSGVVMGSLATALLVVNNLRDIPGDTESAKLTLAVRIGDQATRYLYLALMVVPYLCVPYIAGWWGRPLAVLALVGLPLAYRPVLAVLRGARGPALIPVLQQTAAVQMAIGLALAVGLWWT